MIKRENRQLYITGQDEVIFSTVLFLMNLFLDEKNATRGDVNRAIYYFRDQGMPLDEWLFNHILARWDTRLAWGTNARIVSFPMDECDPAGGEILIYRARRRESPAGVREDRADRPVGLELPRRRDPRRRPRGGLHVELRVGEIQLSLQPT